MACIRHDAVLVAPGEPLQGRLTATLRRNTIGVPFQGDRGYGDRRHGGQASLHIIKLGIAIDESVTVPIRMDHHVDEVWIIESGC